MGFNENEHPRDKDGKFTDGTGEGSAAKIRRVEKKHFPHLTGDGDGGKMGADEKTISGATSGAINPNSEAGNKKAEKLYDAIRKSLEDVGQITSNLKLVAPNMNVSREDVDRIKHYLFLDTHELADGNRTFDPDADIADSWRRLSGGARGVLPHDVTMIRHELLEMRLVDGGMSQEEAHIEAQKKYNYRKECAEYHGQAHKRKMRG